jgi:hypothetical protein
MSKGGVKMPGASVPSRAQAPRDEAPSTNKPSSSKKTGALDKKKADRARPQQQAQRAQRPRGAGAAHGAGGAHAAGAAHGAEEAGGGEQQGVQGLDAGENELHGRRHADADVNWGEQKVEEHHENEAHETGATGADAIKRSKGDTGGGDGFDQGKNQREAYERYMKGNVAADKERFDDLRSRGTKDDFKADRPAKEVEALGIQRAAAHVVRLYDAWTLEGMNRNEAIARAASFLSDFTSSVNIKKVLAELESKPIRDVYPLEVLLRMLDERPELLPGVRSGEVLLDVDQLSQSKRVLAGHAVQVTVPTDCRIKSFALLGGARPGYEFFPSPGANDKYTLLIDTPGTWTFALLAAPLQQLGRIQRETQEALLQIFAVEVWMMGKKGEPLSAEEWAALASLDDDEESDDDDEQAEEALALEPCPLLAVQVRSALTRISKDAIEEGAAAAATTYSWVCELRKPGSAPDSEPLLRIVVEKATAFDTAWVKAREAIAQKQKEYEPSRQPLTQDDVTNALRRVRVS